MPSKARVVIPPASIESTGNLTCKDCKKSFPSIHSYKIHWVRKHSDIQWNTTKNFKLKKKSHHKSEVIVARPVDKPELHMDNMNVNICPRCRCRFAVMIID